MPINITQESYERVKRLPPPQNNLKQKKSKGDPSVPRDGAEPRILFSQIGNVEQFEAIVG